MSKYSFENFYLNMNNKQAFYSSRKAAENLGEPELNPLYIYGGSWTGKTHILYSIEEFVMEHNADKRVIHVTAGNYINDLIKAVRAGNKETADFRELYNSADVLLFDDIDFLAGKEASMDEFLSLFNNLYEAGKQIVITGKSAPNAMGIGMMSDIVSRLEWGKVIEIASTMEIPRR